MVTGSYVFENFLNSEKEMKRLGLQASILKNQEVAFLKRSGLQENMKLLDIGCGLGSTIQMIQSSFQNLDLFGADVNLGFINHCRSHYKNINFFQSSVYELGVFKEKFDFVYARFVFQHLSDPTKALSEIFKILKPGGVLVILDIDDIFYHITPAIKSLDQFFQLAQESQAMLGGDRFIGHKIKDLCKNGQYTDIQEICEVVDSSQIGLKNFLDLTTGLKLEQVPKSMRDHAEILLRDIYQEASSNTSRGMLTLFGINCKKPN